MNYFIPEHKVCLVSWAIMMIQFYPMAGDLNRCKKRDCTASEDICRNFATNDHNRSGPRYLVWTKLLCQFKRDNSWQNWKLSAAYNKSRSVWYCLKSLKIITNPCSSFQVPLSDVWLSTCISDVSELTMDPATSFVIGWPINNAVITFR